LPAVFPPSAVPTFGGLGPWTPATQTGRRDNLSYFGIGGLKADGLNTNYTQQTKPFNPQILVVIIGTNDISSGTDVTPGGAYQTSVATYVDQVHTDFPSCKILWGSAQVKNEQWTAVGPHFLDGTDTWAGNQRVQDAFAASGRSAWCQYFDLISPMLTYETLHNTPAPGITGTGADGSGVLTYDSLHGTPACKVLLAQIAIAQLTFS
jgi:hypothetical protein